MPRLHCMLLGTVCLDRAHLIGVVCEETWPLTVVSCQYSPNPPRDVTQLLRRADALGNYRRRTGPCS
jgi:hypothetical protein